jgi:hypothetical protein
VRWVPAIDAHDIDAAACKFGECRGTYSTEAENGDLTSLLRHVHSSGISSGKLYQGAIADS